MTFSPAVRKLTLTLHITTSVGWLGAVLVFLGLAVLALTNTDPRVVRGVYLVMDPAARWVLMPLALASLFTGAVQSLGTRWGVLQHYWVVFKLVLNAFATVVLWIYMGAFRVMAKVAADPHAALASVRNPSPLVHAVLALLTLLVATVLAVYKPRGVTPLGARSGERADDPR